MNHSSSRRTLRLPALHASALFVLILAALTACSSDVPTSSARLIRPGIGIEGHADIISTAESVEDDGPYPAVGSTAFSRCPDQGWELDASVLFPNSMTPMVFSWQVPETNGALAHFSISKQAITFYGYLSQGTSTSKAIYILHGEVQDAGGNFALLDGTELTMSCYNGRYVEVLGGVKYFGELKIVGADHIESLALDDDAAPPPASNTCDDPLTEEEEGGDCPTAPITGGSGDQRMVQVIEPDTGNTLKLMCDVTYWYESYDGGVTWNYYGEYTVNWGSCAWEPA